MVERKKLYFAMYKRAPWYMPRTLDIKRWAAVSGWASGIAQYSTQHIFLFAMKALMWYLVASTLQMHPSFQGCSIMIMTVLHHVTFDLCFFCHSCAHIAIVLPSRSNYRIRWVFVHQLWLWCSTAEAAGVWESVGEWLLSSRLCIRLHRKC